MFKGRLIACGADAKTVKGNGDEYLTAIMYMKPWKVAGYNLCPMAETAGCVDGCLNSAGRGAFSNVQSARERKALWFIQDREGFMAQLIDDIKRFAVYCERKGVQACVRLNGTSDIRWELIKVDGLNVMQMFPQVQFYDYTKIANRKGVPTNYHLTWSYSEASDVYKAQAKIALGNGMNVAVVFRNKHSIPDMFLDRVVVDGDKDDLRFLDPQSVVVALYAKGQAKKDKSGFVVDV